MIVTLSINFDLAMINTYYKSRLHLNCCGGPNGYGLVWTDLGLLSGLRSLIWVGLVQVDRGWAPSQLLSLATIQAWMQQGLH